MNPPHENQQPTTDTEILRDIVITIDGPSGSGKTTTAREVARRLNLRHLDTGAMYRAVTLGALRAGVQLDDEAAVARVADAARIEFVEKTGEAQRVLLDGDDVSAGIRSPEVNANVSVVSAHGSVRAAMVSRQRMLADRGGVVLEGRDIGSVVLPSAHVKIYLDASIDVRAERRCKEIQEGGRDADVESVKVNLAARDKLDTTREISPLMIPVGACIIDTSALSIEGQVAEVIAIARRTSEVLRALVHQGRGNPFMKKRFVWFACQRIARLVLRVVWGLRIYRKDRVSYGEPYIFACNHRSNLDPPVVGATVNREVHFVAKKSLFNNRPFGALIRFLNAIPMRRSTFDRAVMDQFVEILRSGGSVLIFPEGGRVHGEELGEARPGVGYLALKSGRAVVPIYVDGTYHLGRAFVRKPRMSIVYGKAIRLTDPDLTKYRNPDQFRDFGRMVMTAIGALKDECDRARGAGTRGPR